MNQDLADYQIRQMNEKNRLREQEIIREMEEAEAIKKAIEDDDKIFRSYAERCVNEWDAHVSLPTLRSLFNIFQGKNVTPLILELKKQRMQNLETM